MINGYFRNGYGKMKNDGILKIGMLTKKSLGFYIEMLKPKGGQ
jgi:hypothetical protein